VICSHGRLHILRMRHATLSPLCWPRRLPSAGVMPARAGGMWCVDRVVVVHGLPPPQHVQCIACSLHSPWLLQLVGSRRCELAELCSGRWFLYCGGWFLGMACAKWFQVTVLAVLMSLVGGPLCMWSAGISVGSGAAREGLVRRVCWQPAAVPGAWPATPPLAPLHVQ
jgi:hypothetical protein